ncbi:MAG: PTS system mannose/fructose/sorbose family transporter subunit IID [bacterium]
METGRQNAICLRKSDFLRIILRSFIFQGSWNFKKMQNLGFAFSALPALRRLYPDRKERDMAAHRHLEFYNSHPYMASFVLGAIVRMEERRAQGENIRVEDILLFKKAMMGPMGALGDSFFWASWRPVMGVLAAALALAGWVCAPVVFLLVYNVPHLYVRFCGFRQGYLLERRVVERIRKYDLFRYSAYLKSFMLIILGAMIPVVIKLGEGMQPRSLKILSKLGVLLGILVIAEVFRQKVSLNKVLLIVGSICILLGLLKIV